MIHLNRPNELGFENPIQINWCESILGIATQFFYLRENDSSTFRFEFIEILNHDSIFV